MRSRTLKFAAILAFSVAPLLAQGCIQCATSAHGAGPQGESALFKGMLVLLAPSLALLSGIGVVAFRNRK
jgi:hypothetical protein